MRRERCSVRTATCCHAGRCGTDRSRSDGCLDRLRSLAGYIADDQAPTKLTTDELAAVAVFTTERIEIP